ncbi:MAG: KH domain-containing protein [Bacilli bacterium]|nr:KH domain-containing protein [Bacilli bacterium]
MDVEKLIRDIVDPLVDNKDAIMIRQMPSGEENEIIMLVIGESNDIARLIGRGGSVADSIRKVVGVAGKLNDKRIRIKFESFESANLE